MSIMSSTATANPTQQKNDIKQIGICLPSNSSIEMSTATSTNSLNLSSNSKNVTNTTNNIYTTSTTAGQFGLSVMVAKLNPTRQQQTVILQPRITTTRGATLQIQNSVRGSSINSQNISTTFASSTTSSISVRTRVISGQTNHHTSTIPVLNLSTVATTTASSSNATTNSVKQMIAGQKFIATTGNMETVNLVMTNPNDVRNLKTNVNNEIKSLYKINGPKQLTGSALVTQTSKMISISNSGPTCATRLGILGGSANNKPALINLPKNFIFTPTGASGIANMVSLSSANFSNRIPNQIIARQTVTTTISSQPSMPSSKPTIYTVNTNTNVLNPNIIQTTLQPIMSNSQNALTSSIVSISTSSITTPSTLSNSSKSSIQSINNISPIKSTFPTQTPSSPRPRILSRKRPIDTSTITIKSNAQNVTSLSFSTNQVSSQPNQNEQFKSQQSTIGVMDTIKTEFSDNSENNCSNNNTNNNLTPRKKPRKQLLEPSSPKNKGLNCDHPVNNDQQTIITKQEIKDKLVVIKKPRPSLIIQPNYIVKFPHFSRYSEVKQKHDKKLTLQDLLNDIRKENEWKDFALTEQCKKLAFDEESFTMKNLETFLSVVEEISPLSKCAAQTTIFDNSLTANDLSPVDQKCVRINDIIRANIQRSKVLYELFMECNQIINKITQEHKDKVTNLTKRIANKRNYSK